MRKSNSIIMLPEIPEDIKAHKDIYPFILRSNELEDINPIVSYYCKLYVLDHILNNKLHQTSKSIEGFTIGLLDATESIKNSDDEAITKVLQDKTLSLSVLLNFTLKIFSESLQELSQYTGDKYQKVKLIGKFKACLNFLKLLEIFKNDDIDFSKLTNGKVDTYDLFNKVNKDRMKLLKYNLSKLIKDEIKGDADELDKELEKLKTDGDTKNDQDDAKEEEHGGIDEEDHGGIDEEDQDDAGDMKLPETPKFIDEEGDVKLPEAPKFIDDTSNNESDTNNAEVKLPGAPHFAPDEENSDIKLPGAPKFLPDDDLSHINKNSSIHVFESKPDKPETSSPPPQPPTGPSSRKSSGVGSRASVKPQHPAITKENIGEILDKQELVAKIQKLCKFAISALNYEDLNTAEKELSDGLEMIKRLKQQEK